MSTMIALPRPLVEYLAVLREQIDNYRSADPKEIDPETAHMMHVDGEILAGLPVWLKKPTGDVPRLQERLEILRSAIKDCEALSNDPELGDEWKHDAELLTELVAWLTSFNADPRDN